MNPQRSQRSPTTSQTTCYPRLSTRPSCRPDKQRLVARCASSSHRVSAASRKESGSQSNEARSRSDWRSGAKGMDGSDAQGALIPGMQPASEVRSGIVPPFSFSMRLISSKVRPKIGRVAHVQSYRPRTYPGRRCCLLLIKTVVRSFDTVCLPHTSLLRASRARRIRHSTCLRNSEHRVCDNILFRRFLSCTSICTFTFGSSVGAHFHGTGTGSSHFLDRFEPIFGFLLFDTRLASFFLQSSCHCFATLYTS
jgi:hypothetical protein